MCRTYIFREINVVSQINVESYSSFKKDENHIIKKKLKLDKYVLMNRIKIFP